MKDLASLFDGSWFESGRMTSASKARSMGSYNSGAVLERVYMTTLNQTFRRRPSLAILWRLTDSHLCGGIGSSTTRWTERLSMAEVNFGKAAISSVTAG